MINIDATIKQASKTLNITKNKFGVKLSADGKNSGNQHDLVNILNEPNKIITIKPDVVTIKLITTPAPKPEASLNSLLAQVAQKVSKIALKNGVTTEDCLTKIKASL
jgi:radical SAM superfamily enzyme